MFRFIRNIILLGIVAALVGEVVVRVTHAVSDLPQRVIDQDGIQKYRPNQDGYWIGGDHTWMINSYGWPGELPKDFNNLVTVIGDSFIENFMNPNECHQSNLLKEQLPSYNFLETARSGVSFIEAFEIAKQMDTLNPVKTLVYVNYSDFHESIRDIGIKPDITQLDIANQQVVYGQMKAPGLKKILYNWKLAYYLYNRFIAGMSFNLNFEQPVKKEKIKKDKVGLKSAKEIESLLQFTKTHYNITNTVLVFHPGTNPFLVEMCETMGFQVLLLDSSLDKQSWTFDYDHHWTCYGHEQVAKQVATFLDN